MGGMGGSFYGGATLLCFEIQGYHLLLIYGGLRYWTKTKQFTGATLFVRLAPDLSCPLATLLHRSTSLGSSDGGGYVFSLFGLLVFWFPCWFPCSSLSGKDGGVSLSLHVSRVSQPKTNIVDTILF